MLLMATDKARPVLWVKRKLAAHTDLAELVEASLLPLEHLTRPKEGRFDKLSEVGRGESSAC
jgi:hypothetical protein